mgnify:CR=1 FL=1
MLRDDLRRCVLVLVQSCVACLPFTPLVNFHREGASVLVPDNDVSRWGLKEAAGLTVGGTVRHAEVWLLSAAQPVCSRSRNCKEIALDDWHMCVVVIGVARRGSLPSNYAWMDASFPRGRSFR